MALLQQLRDEMAAEEARSAGYQDCAHLLALYSQTEGSLRRQDDLSFYGISLLPITAGADRPSATNGITARIRVPLPGSDST